MRSIFLNQDVDNEWQHKRSWGRWSRSQGEFSFLVNIYPNLGNSLAGDKVWLMVQAWFSTLICFCYGFLYSY
jgi:hypothetical protein